MKKSVVRIEGCGSKQADILSCIESLIIDLRQKIESQFSLKTIALFLMAEKSDGRKVSVKMIESFKREGEIQLTTEYPSQIEKSLWTIFIEREIACNNSLYGDKLPKYFSALVVCKSSFLGLMLWLFPELVTEDRITDVANIEKESLATWMLGDRMLFWLACIHGSNCRPEKARYVEAQIRKHQLDSGAFTTVEGKDEKGNLISSAIGLLVLVSCARQNGSEDAAVCAAQKTAYWLVNQLYGVQSVDESKAWVLYAFSEYLTLFK